MTNKKGFLQVTWEKSVAGLYHALDRMDHAVEKTGQKSALKVARDTFLVFSFSCAVKCSEGLARRVERPIDYDALDYSKYPSMPKHPLCKK